MFRRLHKGVLTVIAESHMFNPEGEGESALDNAKKGRIPSPGKPTYGVWLPSPVNRNRTGLLAFELARMAQFFGVKSYCTTWP